jgi:hypothetical protein
MGRPADKRSVAEARGIVAVGANDVNLLQDLFLIFATVAVAAIGMAVIQFMRRQVHARDPGRDDPLAAFREAYEAGEMDTAEFERIGESLAGGKPPAAPPPTPASTESPPAAGPPSI